jgi:hypothetical protein
MRILVVTMYSIEGRYTTQYGTGLLSSEIRGRKEGTFRSFVVSTGYLSGNSLAPLDP